MFDLLALLAPSRKRPVSQSLWTTLRHLGAAGLFTLAIIDAFPLPTFGGPDILTAILAASHKPLWWEYGASATAGSIIGAYITFTAARKAGAGYLEKKFKKGKLSKFMNVFRHWGTGTLIASTAIPLPSPTSMFFAAAGAGDYPLGRFLVIIATCRAVRYFGIAYLAGHYGRTFLRVLRHPMDHWGWLLFFIMMTGALVLAGVLVSRRLETAPE
jgi:membrane protein YqaA with SNARE-associated domain